jgi:hypothetical protein
MPHVRNRPASGDLALNTYVLFDSYALYLPWLPLWVTLDNLARAAE